MFPMTLSLSGSQDPPPFADISPGAKGDAGEGDAGEGEVAGAAGDADDAGGRSSLAEDTFAFPGCLPSSSRGSAANSENSCMKSSHLTPTGLLPTVSRRSSVSSRFSISSSQPPAGGRGGHGPNMQVIRAKLNASRLLAKAAAGSGVNTGSSQSRNSDAEPGTNNLDVGTSSCSGLGGFGAKREPFTRENSILTKGGVVKYGASGEGVARCERRIFVAFRVIQIGEIDIRDQAFICRFDLFVEWFDEEACKLSPADLAKETSDHFEPTIRFTNADDFTLKEKNWIVFPETKFVGYRVTVQGRFRIQFDFQSFPFDVQRLIIELTMGRERGTCTLLHNELCQFRHSANQANTLMQQFSTEYTFRPLRYRITTTSSIEGMDGKQTSQYQLIAPIRRIYSYYLTQIYVIAIIIQALAFGVFAIPYDDSTRLEVLAALVLVLTAFKLQVSHDLPKVPRMTQLDRYLLAVHFFFGGIYVHVCMALAWHEDMTQETDRSVFQFSLAIWGVMHLCFLCLFCSALLNQKFILSTFGEMDANLQTVLKEAGYVLKDNVMQGDLRFDDDGVDITEWTIEERGQYGNKKGWCTKQSTICE